MARLAPQAQARSAPQSSTLRGCPLLQSPMMPLVNPAPLSACTLTGINVAYPHPRASACCCHVGPAGAEPGGGPGKRNPGGKTKPNSIITGTGPVAFAGVLRV